MAKTDLTKTIESALSSWNPTKIGGVLINSMRQGFDAYEVPVECGDSRHGLIDYVAVQECLLDVSYENRCELWQKYHSWKNKTEMDFETEKQLLGCNQDISKGQKGFICEPDDNRCFYRYKAKVATCGILITCVEVKVSKADFKSNHGHNFPGNCNFYAVPRDLYPDIKDLVPEGIGVLLYYDGSTPTGKKATTAYPYVGIRTRVDCQYRPMADVDQKWLILSTAKRNIKAAGKHSAGNGRNL